jgi:hypothetical protein
MVNDRVAMKSGPQEIKGGHVPDPEECSHLSCLSLGTGSGEWRTLTWPEAYEHIDKERRELSRLVGTLQNLSRCEHGRHEGENCNGCEGPSHGNPLMGPDRVIGYDLGGRPIRVPERGEKWAT